MIQTREWQTGSDYSEIKELDQVLRYQNKTWHVASEADIYWLKCKKTFLYLLNIIQASFKHFAPLISVLTAVSINMSPGSTSYSVYFTSKVTPNTEIQTYSFWPNKFFEWKHNSASSSSKWWHFCSWFDWHSCSRDAKHRHCSSSALISVANNLLPQWTEVPNATGTPSIHATGNSLNDLSFPATQEITSLSHHYICLLIVGE